MKPLIVAAFLCCSPLCYSQSLQGDLDLSMQYQQNFTSSFEYEEISVYLDYYAWDRIKISWGLGLGARDGRQFKHFHMPAGPLIGAASAIAIMGLTSEDNSSQSGDYDEYGNYDINGGYDSDGFYVGTDESEDDGGGGGGAAFAFVIGLAVAALPEKISFDMISNKHFVSGLYLRPFGMHVARKSENHKAKLMWSYGLGWNFGYRFDSGLKFTAFTELQAVGTFKQGAFLGGRLSIPLN